jgi:hypothetical protein
MTRAPVPRTPKDRTAIQCTKRGSAPPTVASLGLRVHLIPASPERDPQLAHLIASCEMLRADLECLFQRIIAHLNDGCEQPHDENSSASHSYQSRR